MKRMMAALVVIGAAGTGCDGSQESIDPPAPMPDASPFEYPIELWDRQEQGETMLLVHVTETGDVDTVAVHVSSGHDAFDSAAVRGARRLRFSPARQGDRRIPAWTRVPVRFRMDTTGVLGTGQGGGE